MTTSAQLVTLFTTDVFQHSSVSLYSTNLIPYDIVRDSEPELERLYLNQEINAFVLLITRGEQIIDLSARQFAFNINITYFRAKDTSGNNWGAVRNAFEAIADRVYSQLVSGSSALIDILEPQAGPPQITQVNEFEEQVWRGVFNYTALKR
jgi:hypothetical protein